MKVSLSNGMFSKLSLKENFAAVRKLGFENIEFNMKSVEVEDDVSAYLARTFAEKYGIRCASLHGATLYVKDAVEIHRAIYYQKISIDFARILSAPIMVVHSNVSKRIPVDQRKKILQEVFREVKTYAEDKGVRLALENLSYASTGFGKNVEELEEVFTVLDGMEYGSTGFTLDFSHSTASGTTFSLLDRFHERLCNVHMSHRAHKPFSEENANLMRLLSSLRKHKYDGLITLELNRKTEAEGILSTKSVIENALGKSS